MGLLGWRGEPSGWIVALAQHRYSVLTDVHGGSGHWASVSHGLMPTVYHPPADIGGREPVLTFFKFVQNYLCVTVIN